MEVGGFPVTVTHEWQVLMPDEELRALLAITSCARREIGAIPPSGKSQTDVRKDPDVQYMIEVMLDLMSLPEVIDAAEVEDSRARAYWGRAAQALERLGVRKG
jgi:hypothetical protein